MGNTKALEPVPHIDEKTYNMAVKAITHLQAQLAERDAQLAALVDGMEWLIPYAKVQQRYVFAPDFQGWCKFVSAFEATRQPTQDKGEE